MPRGTEHAPANALGSALAPGIGFQGAYSMRVRQQRFIDTLAAHYHKLFVEDRDYAYVRCTTTPENLARKMTNALFCGTGNKDGKGIRFTCRDLGIKYTYTAIKAYLMDWKEVTA